MCFWVEKEREGTRCKFTCAAIQCEKTKVKWFVDCGSVKHVPPDET